MEEENKEDGETRGGRTPRGLHGTGYRLRAEKGGRTDVVNGIISSHIEQSAEMSNGGCQVTGVGDIQVGGILIQERSWGAVVIESCYDNKWILMGGR